MQNIRVFSLSAAILYQARKPVHVYQQQKQRHIPDECAHKARLRARPVVFIGLMGAGKTTIGRYMAYSLDLPFCDADQEIEIAANIQIKDIFADYGEAEFRILEKR